jgi:hypothetical protein
LFDNCDLLVKAIWNSKLWTVLIITFLASKSKCGPWFQKSGNSGDFMCILDLFW